MKKGGPMFYRNEIDFSARTDGCYPWYDLEEYTPDGGMWSIPAAADRRRHIDAAEQLMANPDEFRQAMRLAIREWPRSASVALGNPSMNHKAWLGHAGCYLATGSPEETTRLGWHNLDEGEQLEANQAAADIITEWRNTGRAGFQPSLWDHLPSLRRFTEGAAHA